MTEQSGPSTTESSVEISPSPAPAPEKEKRHRGVWGIQKKDLNELAKAEQISVAAVKYARQLARRAIDSPITDKFRSDIESTRTKVGEAMQGFTRRRQSTAAEREAERNLLAALREIQSAAKQRFARTNQLALKNYNVGRKLNGSRPRLEQTAASLLARAEEDSLPGIPPSKLKEFRSAQTAWMEAGSLHVGHESLRQSDTHERNKLIESIRTQRIQIQYAADAEWPYWDPASAPIRVEFCLPPHQPFIIKTKSMA